MNPGVLHLLGTSSTTVEEWNINFLAPAIRRNDYIALPCPSLLHPKITSPPYSTTRVVRHLSPHEHLLPFSTPGYQNPFYTNHEYIQPRVILLFVIIGAAGAVCVAYGVTNFWIDSTEPSLEPFEPSQSQAQYMREVRERSRDVLWRYAIDMRTAGGVRGGECGLLRGKRGWINLVFLN